MALFKKSKDKERKEYIQSLQKLASTCELCLQYASKTDHFDKMSLLCDEVKYLLPFEHEDIKVIDSKMKNVLDDLKILLYTNRDPYRVQGKLNDLETLIRERSSKV
jgi:hypothetical protein